MLVQGPADIFLGNIPWSSHLALNIEPYHFSFPFTGARDVRHPAYWPFLCGRVTAWTCTKFTMILLALGTSGKSYHLLALLVPLL